MVKNQAKVKNTSVLRHTETNVSTMICSIASSYGGFATKPEPANKAQAKRVEAAGRALNSMYKHGHYEEYIYIYIYILTRFVPRTQRL